MGDGSRDSPTVLGRLLFGGTLLYMAVDGFKNNEKRVDIARDRGVPMPELMVPVATALLLVASLMLVLWLWPLVAIVLLLAFFFSTTPSIHCFWRFEGKERANQKINFLKNIIIVGGLLVFLEEALQDDS